MPKLSPRAARIKAAAEAAYGKRGLTQLAKAADVSQQMLSFIVRGERTVSETSIARSRRRWQRRPIAWCGRTEDGQTGAADASRNGGVKR
ncbi:helix-turn-helix transcriptional regulator [Bradyrhizobium ottawaense]|uniref:helix-turn-helix transcriptional regulator n=1 Tax=Bradyrhizobium ottawaense TaxID=931866 RepID=UPI0030F3BFA9